MYTGLKKCQFSLFSFEDIGINVFKLFFQVTIIFTKNMKEYKSGRRAVSIRK